MTHKELKVPFTSFVYLNDDSVINAANLFLDSIPRNCIEYKPWEQFPYSPNADFAIAYTEDSILLKYYVKEEFLRAFYSKPNDPVYKDSCVEFFIAFEEEENYYNLEFNCAGACLIGFGPNRDNRELLNYSTISKITSQTLIKSSEKEGEPLIKWEITSIIPFDVFSFHSISSLAGKNCRANFYKCGDDLPKPHYLSWNNIFSDKPDFHLSSFFGKLNF